MRIYRNKSIAHWDRDVALDMSTSLPLIYPQSVDDALSAAGKVLDQLMEGYQADLTYTSGVRKKIQTSKGCYIT